MTQEDRVIDYIERFGSISPMEAFIDLGITKLATVVSRLKREKGYRFYQHFESTKNRFDEKVFYMRYWLKFDIFKDYMERKAKQNVIIRLY